MKPRLTPELKKAKRAAVSETAQAGLFGGIVGGSLGIPAGLGAMAVAATAGAATVPAIIGGAVVAGVSTLGAAALSAFHEAGEPHSRMTAFHTARKVARQESVEPD
jgi:hypothetical protein